MDKETNKKEEGEEEKAWIWEIVILKNRFNKLFFLVEETIQNILNIKLCWGTPYMDPTHNKQTR